MRLKKRLKLHEGYRGKPYFCDAGYWTIAYGHRMKNGMWISKKVAAYILKNDIWLAKKQLKSLNLKLNWARRSVCVEMIFWHGLSGFCNFVKTVIAIRDEDWNKAANELMDSDSGRKYSKRMTVLANIMRKGES